MPRSQLTRLAAPLAALVLLAGACRAAGPRPIALDEEDCGYCRMTISDARFGAQVVTAKGKALTFDSIECLAGYVAQAAAGAPVRAAWVTDFTRPGTFVAVDSARFLRGGPASPMGRELLAVAADADLAALQRELGAAESLDWAGVLALVAGTAADVGTHAEHGVHAESAADGAHASAATAAAAADAGRATLVVSPDGALRSVGEAVRGAPAGARIVVRPGIYREPTILVDRPLEIVGEGAAVLDGEGARQILTVAADSVTVRGLTFRNVGRSYVEDRAAIRVAGARGCRIEDNRLEDTFFGVYLAEVEGCRVAGNEIVGTGGVESSSGNGIHLFTSRDVVVSGNRVSGHRDGIYLEFARAVVVQDNVSERNVRYGLHFMYSDSSRYERNAFTGNSAGVAVMYTKVVHMAGNTFAGNWGPAAYGLLLKEIADATLVGNRFEGNTTALLADGATRLEARGNRFARNGWAVRLMASTQDGRFAGNDFVANTFDVATNSRSSYSRFEGNYWDAYRGYDLDRDGVGDVPFRPVRLFSLVVEHNPPALVLLRSMLVDVLDAVERVVPSLTPATLVDPSPAMRSHS